MSTSKKHLIFSFLLLLACVPTATQAQAEATNSTEQVEGIRLAADETRATEWWLSTTQLDLAGTLEQDCFFVAEEALLSGTFEQDVWGGAAEIRFSGSAAGDLRFLARQQIILSGEARDGCSALAPAGTVQVQTNGVLRGNANLQGTLVIVEGRVEGDADISANRVTVKGYIGGDLRLTADDVSLLPGARIDGDLVYSSPRLLVIPDGVELGGELRRETNPPRPWYAGLGLRLFLFVGSLLTGLVGTWLFPRFLGQAAHYVQLRRGPCMLVGSLAGLLIPLLCWLCAFSLVALPLVGVCAALYGVLLYAAKIPVALAFGGLLMARLRPGKPIPIGAAVSLGLVVFFGLSTLPVVGVSVWLVLSFLGFGALLLTLVQSQRGVLPPAKPAVETPTESTPA